MKKKQLTDLSGTWKLLSFELKFTGGTILHPFGQNAKGLLIYTKGGYMNGKVMSDERFRFTSEDHLQASPDEIKAAFNGFIGYYGTYEVDHAKGIVSHHIEGSMFPNWEGQSQERYFKLNGDKLTLSTPPQPFDNEEAIGVLTWEKVE